MKDKPQVPALQPDESPSESLEATAIAAYLEAHPDFFVEHEDLLATLRIPHQRGDTISLVPGLTLKVTQTATGPIEQFKADDQK